MSLSKAHPSRKASDSCKVVFTPICWALEQNRFKNDSQLLSFLRCGRYRNLDLICMRTSNLEYNIVVAYQYEIAKIHFSELWNFFVVLCRPSPSILTPGNICWPTSKIRDTFRINGGRRWRCHSTASSQREAWRCDGPQLIMSRK